MVRTRFAPSPTGYLHVGGLRTALYNYLFAKQNNGKFVLRIEDTDQKRKVDGAVENLIESLNWSGIEADEGPVKQGDFGPYIQSERLELYKKHVDILLEKEHAYPCFCTRERLKKLKESQSDDSTQFGYDNHCRNLSRAEVMSKIKNGESYVVRLKTPLEGEVVIYDIVRGKVTFPNELLDDQVILKSDGFPTYHLANVVDDHLMEISHVIRGEEWLSSTPKHKLLYDYFGWKTPKFAHLPLLLNQDKSKLSKRQGDVAVEDYMEKGYLPEAIMNFLLLLGWNPGNNKEIFSLKEMVKSFSLKKVNKSGSIFNIEKLNWFNGQYIRSYDLDGLYKISAAYFPKNTNLSENEEKKILSLIQERLSTLQQIPKQAALILSDSIEYNKDALDYIRSESGMLVLKSLAKIISCEDELHSSNFFQIIKKVQAETLVKGKQLWMIVRVGLTGEIHGPEINKIAELLGKEKCLARINQAIKNG